MSDNINNPASVAIAQERKQFWVKVATIAVLLIVVLLKPKVDVWLAANAGNNNGELNNRGTEVASKKTIGRDAFESDVVGGGEIASGNTQRGTLKITDPNDETMRAPTAGSTSDSNALIAEADSGIKTPPKLSGASSSSTKPSTTRPSGQKADSKPGTSSKASGTDTRSNPDRDSGNASKSRGASEPPLGKLTLTNKAREEFRSTAGLMYVRGSEDGHRLKHVLKHAEDNLDKPVHGVYSGSRDQILAWIDEAYLKGKKGGKGTRVANQGDRTVYTVDLGEKIGFVGGQTGERKRNPECRFLRLVIQDGTEVVTAYPSQSL